ncbi:MAG: hypothetical protein AB1640_23350 [bacterium]
MIRRPALLLSVRLAAVLLLPGLLLPRPATAATFYASPDGRGHGRSPDAPFEVADFWAVAGPGDTLYLTDGRYRGARAMIRPPARLSGRADALIRIAALHDGRVTVDGEMLRRPVALDRGNGYFIVEGINACSAGPPGGSGSWGVVHIDQGSDHNRIRRVCAWDAPAKRNSYIFFVGNSAGNLIEDCAGWGPARKIFGRHQDARTTFRRCFARWTHLDGDALHTYAIGITWSYRSTGSLVENCISTWDEYPDAPSAVIKSGAFGVDDTFADGGYRLLGCIAYQLSGQRGSPNQLYHHNNCDPGTRYLIRDCIAYTEKPGVNPFNMQVMSFAGSHLTSIGGGGDGSTGAGVLAAGQTGPIESSIVMGSRSRGLYPGSLLDYVLFWDNAAADYTDPAPAHFAVRDPRITGPGRNVLQHGLSEDLRPHVAERSVGAQIQYRYVDGVLTREPLWPWPMNERIADAMVQSGYSFKGGVDGKGGVDLTRTVFQLAGGSLPEDLGLQPPPPPRSPR